MRVVISRLLLLISLSVLGLNCSSKHDKTFVSVNDISSNNIISTQFPEVTIFYEKNVNDNSLIALTNLGLMSIEFITLPNEGNFPILLPNGTQIAYIRSYFSGIQEPHGIWLYDYHNNETRRIPIFQEDYRDVYLSCPSFSLRGDKIIFSVTWFESKKTGLGKIDIDGNNLEILQTDLVLNNCPEFSPDLKTILAKCVDINTSKNRPGFQLCLLDENGSYIKTITNRGNGHHSYYFSPDGKYIVYSEFDIKLFSFLPTDRFYSYDFESGEKKLLLEWEVSTKGFSNDSQQIIFEGRPNPKSPWGIYIINIDGTNLRHLTYFDEFLEDWYSDIEEY